MRLDPSRILAGVTVLLLSASLAFSASPSTPKVYNVRDYGATGIGSTLDTRAIQQAIDLAHADSGGTVCFPPGKYLSGTIFLKSNVTLLLETGSTLLGSPDTLDYPVMRPKYRSYTDTYVNRSLIYAEDQHHIGIRGGGTIDGQGQAFQWKAYGSRPDGLRIIACRCVTVEGVSMQSSGLWMQHYLGCEFVTVHGIHVWNHSTWNNDMIDIDCCRNVTISDCYGNSDDDALTLKSTADHPTENVTITNCVLGSGCNAIKMGTESNGGFKNITISNCVIDSDVGAKGFYALPRGIGGIVLEIVDGGTLENVTITNIAMKNVMVPLFLRFANRARAFRPDMEKPGIGTYRNVLISNITATGVDSLGCSVTGLPGHPLTGITISNLRFTYPGGGTAAQYHRPVPELEAEYPEAMMFGALPAWGLYVRHAEGLRLQNLDFVLESPDSRPALVFEDVKGLDIDGFTERRADSPGAPTVEFRGVSRAFLRGCRPADGTPVFLNVLGASSRLSLMGNDLAGAKKAFEVGAGVAPAEIFESANRLGQ